MSSTSTASKIYRWATTQRNLTIFVAIIVAVPMVYAVQSIVGGSELSGDFLLLMALAVGVPTAYDEYWPYYDQTWKAIMWICVTCVVATIEFTSLYLVGTEFVNLPPLFASISAFLITDLGNLAWLSIRQR